DAWLTEISGTPAHATLRQIFADHPSVSAFVAGLAEFSPYLWELVRRDPARFVTLLESDPDLHLAAIIADATRAIAESEDEDTVMRPLRRMKQDGALLVALADIGGGGPGVRGTPPPTGRAAAAGGPPGPSPLPRR